MLACSSGHASSDGVADEALSDASNFDVNDVSLLFPLPSKPRDIPLLLGLDASGQHGPLLSTEKFKKLLSYAMPDANEDPTFHQRGFDDPNTWRVVAVRVDPCAKTSVDSSECHVQLRLVTQAVVAEGSSVSAEDQAIHLIYELPATEASGLVADLVALKKSSGDIKTAGKPLGVHPAMKAQGLTGAFTKRLEAFVLKYAGEQRLPFATVMLTLNAGTWRFAQGQNDSDGGFHQQGVPFSSDQTITFRGTTGTVGNFILSVEPPATSADNVNVLVDSSKGVGPPGRFWKLTPSEQEAAVQAALRIDNPLKNTPSTTDCVSCHQASRGLVRVKGVGFLNAADRDENRYIAPSGLTTKFAADPSSGEYTLRGFGYLHRTVVYTQGVVNSSANVVATIRRMQTNPSLIGDRPPTEPGPAG